LSERKLRILYAGSPLASSIVLKALLIETKQAVAAASAAGESTDAGCGYEIAGVLTNPPSAQGRHKELVPTDVAKTVAEWNKAHADMPDKTNGSAALTDATENFAGGQIPVFTPEHLDTAAREAIAPIHADILVCFDYGRIFGPKFLALFPLGGINLHPSALPKYRGCTPVPGVILAGDKTLGISVQKLALKTDEGDLLAATTLTLDGTETTGSLMDGDGTHSVITDAGIVMLKKILSETARSRIVCTSCVRNESHTADSASSHVCDASATPFLLPAATPQSGESSYTPFIRKEDGAIDWTRTADEIDRQIRAYTPWPGCYTTSGGVQLRILAACPLRTADSSCVKSTAGTADSAASRMNESACTAAPGTVLPYDKSVGVQIACGGGTVLVATKLQWQGKNPMMYKDFMNGARNFVGTVLC
jgi:methionyl-tRNA formyltransferase